MAVPNRYPTTSYRPASNAASGFQRSVPRGLVPANDNFRLPVAANDNVRLPKAPRIPFGAAAERSLVRKTTMFGLRRVLPRLIPIVGEALVLYDLYRLFAGQDAVVPGWSHAGFHRINDCGYPEQVGLLGTYACYYTFFAPSPISSNIGLQPDTTLYTMFYNYFSAPGHISYRPAAVYQRDVGFTGDAAPTYNVDGQPAKKPVWGVPLKFVPVPFQAPDFFPALDPDILPIAEPAAVPQPVPFRIIPYRRGNPFRVDQPERGNEIVAGKKGKKEEAREGVIFEPSGNSTKRTRHKYKRPRRKEKEKKARIPVDTLFFKALSQLTEWKDFVEALYKALPNRLKAPFRFPDGKIVYRKGGRMAIQYNPPPDIKAIYLYKAFSKFKKPRYGEVSEFDKFLADAFKNVLTNQIQDYVIGKLSSGASKLNRSEYFGNRSLGLQTGKAL